MKSSNPLFAKWKLAASAVLCLSFLLLLTQAEVRRLAQRAFNSRPVTPVVVKPAQAPALRTRGPLAPPVAAPIFAPFDIPRSVIAGGGGQDGSAGQFTLQGTIAQSTLGSTSLGQFGLVGGFWPGDSALSPTISKMFGAATILVGGTTSLSFTINNVDTATTLNNVSFTDTLPTGLVVDTPNGLSGTCGGGTITATQNTGTVSLSGAVLAPSSSCTFSVNVKGTTVGVKNNTVSVTANEASGTTPGTASVTVIGPPDIAKGFSPMTIVTGQTSTLTITVTNPNTSTTLNGIGFTDSLPVGITAANASTTACGGTLNIAGNVITLTGGSLNASSNCMIPVTVTGAQASLTAYTNTINSVSSSNAGTNNTPATAMLTVNKANTTTAITNGGALATASVVGQAYAVSVMVTPVSPGMGVPSGTVNVSDGTGGTCMAMLSGGTGSCNLTSTSAGAKTITAVYMMDSNFNGSTSSGVPHQVNAANTTTTISNAGTLGSTPTVVGQSYAVTWSVTVNMPGGGTPTGNVTVVAGVGNICTAAVSAGTCNITSTTAGAKSITATYSGDTNYNSSTFGSASHTVNKADTTTTITNAGALAASTAVGQSYAVTWSVAVNSPGAVGAALTGNVTVSDGTDTCTAAVSAGTCNLTSTTTGAKTITATYAGDTNYNGSASTGVPHTVTKPGTTTTITADTPDPTVTGESYNVAVSVAATPPGMGTPTGTVNVSDGTGGTCVVTLSGGAGSCNLTSTTAGAKTLTAVYAGDANFNGSTSAGAPHTVNKADTTLSNLTDSPDPSVVGQPYTCGFTLNITSPGMGTPTGTVSVNDGAGGTCTATLPATSCQLTSIVAGNKTVTFTYNGDANFNGSPSNTAGHAVSKASTTVAITSDLPDPSVIGQNYAVTAAVTVTSPGGGTPTGTITVTDGTNNCTITLPATSCNLPSTSVGAKTLTATYSGDANYNGSGPSAGAPHTVNKADVTVAITSDNPDSSQVGQNVTVVFTVVAAAPGAGTPTGNVTVTVSGGAETCTGTVAAGQCTLALTTPGARTLTATYAGDANFNSGASAGEPHTVVAPPSIAKSFTPPSTPINGTTALTLTITNPAANTVALTGVGFTDNFPNSPNLVVANPFVSSNTCGGTLQDGGGGTLAAGDTGIKLVGGAINANSTCTVTVNVTPIAAGPHVNVTGNVSSTNGGTGNTATATLLTNTPPTISSDTVPVKAGSSAASFTIATATDPDQAVNTLGITINGNPTTASSNGVTVSGVAIQANGSVTANIATTCAATSATFNLVVTDNATATGTGTLTVNITANMPPMLSYNATMVTAGTAPTINPAVGPSDNGTFTIGSVSVSPNNGGLGVLLNQSNGVVTVLNALLIGNYTVTVPATDNCGATNNAMLAISVVCPTITLSPASLPNATVNLAYPQTLSASPAGGNYSFAVTSGLLPPGLTLNSNGSFSGAPTQSGPFNFRVTASGFGGCTAFQDYALLVICPTITLAPASLPGGTSGTAYSQSVAGSPAGSYSYSVSSGALPTGVSLNPATGALTGTLTGPGTFNFTITAMTGGCSGSQAYTVVVTCPTITVSPTTLAAGTAGQAYAPVTFTAAGAFGGSASWLVSAGALPPGMTLSPTGVLSGTPTQTGTFNFTVQATDSFTCMGTQAVSLTINCQTYAINPSGLPNGQAGAAYSQTLSTTGSLGTVTYSVNSGALPPGLTLNGATGAITGAPTALGSSTFEIKATDGNGCMALKSYTVSTTCPTYALAALPAATAGTAYNQSLSVTPNLGGPFSFAVTGGALPGGLTLNPSSGLISGTPTTAGTFNFTVTVTGFGAACATAVPLSITIACPALSLAPVALPDGTLGTAYSQSVTASPAGTYSYAVTSGTLPPGLSLNPATGTLTGTPSAGGSYAFAITATGFGSCTVTRSYNLLINATCGTITVNPTSLPAGVLGTAYNQTVTASPAGTYTFSVVSGALPAGLTLDANTGVISGTPTATGNFTPTIRATSGGCTGQRLYVISIACGMVTVNPTSLPNGTVGVAYSQTITASPAGTYTYTVFLGSLPPGFMLDSATGVLSGSSSTTGMYNFTVRALRAGGGSCAGTRSYSFSINNPPPSFAPLDFDGDRRSELVRWWPEDGALVWEITRSSDEATRREVFGAAAATPVAADYDGDGRADLAVFEAGAWLIRQSASGKLRTEEFGAAGDVPVPGDYDGDGKSDLAVYRAGLWLIHHSSAATVHSFGLGEAGSVPVPADYDGDGRSDLAVFQAGVWLLQLSGDGRQTGLTLGRKGDVPLAADFDGDGQAELAVWRASEGALYVGNEPAQAFARLGRVPFISLMLLGDFDGDGRAELAVRQADGAAWQIVNGNGKER